MLILRTHTYHVVAPHAGAWIETRWRRLCSATMRVAPHAGAWIETNGVYLLQRSMQVAPHAGAWIETNKPFAKQGSKMSHPMRVRGLKHDAIPSDPESLRVAPHAGAWIEIPISAHVEDILEFRRIDYFRRRFKDS